GPQYAVTGLDRGFGEYDDQFESSLYLCAATGPVIGPCLAVMGGLVALAGAASSLVYSVQQGAAGQSATTATRAAFKENPALPGLSARIAEQANQLATHLGDPVDLVADPTAATCAGGTPIPRGIATLDIAELKVKFEPGYQFQLTAVARLHTEFCGGDRREVDRRLAYLGPMTSMSKDTVRANRALDTAVNDAVEALGTNVHAYMREYLLGYR
ncbi:MAG: hypothetical protein ACREXT_18040, partial [Gammaproteobacteria bacterium]